MYDPNTLEEMMLKRNFVIIIILLCTIMGVVACENGGDPNPPIGTVTYRITFETGVDDLVVPAIVALSGTPISAPTEPERLRYRFDGWFAPGSTTPYVFGFMPASDLTLTAKWTRHTTIAFNSDGGSAVSPITAAPGDPVSTPANPSKPGYKFVGWTWQSQLYTFSVMPDTDILLRASWEVGVNIYFVTGDPNVIVNPISQAPGTAISAPPTPVRDGYVFQGWLHNGALYSFGTMPSEDITLVASWASTLFPALPTMSINLKQTNGSTVDIRSVDRNNYVRSEISLSNISARYAFSNEIAEFRGRGNGSWDDGSAVADGGYFKRSYRIKFNSKIGMFGLPESRHWVLHSGTSNAEEISMYKNILAQDLARNILTGIEWAGTCQPVEMYVNDKYYGVYIVMEQVRVANDRVDIDSDYLPLGADPASTGYLVEYDAYAKGNNGIDYFVPVNLPNPGIIGANFRYNFSIKSPDPDDFGTDGFGESAFRAQVTYIRDYISQVYTAAYNSRSGSGQTDTAFDTLNTLVDMDSFVDMYILQEFMKNTDTGYSSFFMYKKPNGLLYLGPPWDFDLSANRARGEDIQGSISDNWDRFYDTIYVARWNHLSPNCASELFICLMTNPTFRSLVAERWAKVSQSIKLYISGLLSEDFIAAYSTQMQKNFTLWKFESNRITNPDTWANYTRNLRDWLLKRAGAFDGMLGL